MTRDGRDRARDEAAKEYLVQLGPPDHGGRRAIANAVGARPGADSLPAFLRPGPARSAPAIASIRRRLDLATPGPWTARPSQRGWQVVGPMEPLVAVVPGPPTDAQVQADAQLIAHAWHDVGALLGALDPHAAPRARPISAFDLEVIAARVRAATEGPWAWHWTVGQYRVHAPADEGRGIAMVLAEGSEQRVRDVAFIAAARADLDGLLVETRRQEGEAGGRVPRRAGPE